MWPVGRGTIEHTNADVMESGRPQQNVMQEGPPASDVPGLSARQLSPYTTSTITGFLIWIPQVVCTQVNTNVGCLAWVRGCLILDGPFTCAVAVLPSVAAGR